MPEVNSKFVSLIHTRYLASPYVCYAKASNEEHDGSVLLEGDTTTGDLVTGTEVHFVFVLYTVAVGPYSFAGQYHLHRAFANKEDASTLLDEIKVANAVPDGIIYEGDAQLDNVYVLSASVTKDKVLMDAVQKEALGKQRAKVKRAVVTPQPRVTTHSPSRGGRAPYAPRSTQRRTTTQPRRATTSSTPKVLGRRK